jgi:hypothetical protein
MFFCCNKPLIAGHRYLFHVNVDDADIKYQFRANFMDILEKTLRIDKYAGPHTCGSYETRLHTYPISWIVKVEDMTDIVSPNDTRLLSDILLEIDGYV